MKNKLLYLLIFLSLFGSGCKIAKTQSEEKCFILEESFAESSMKYFLSIGNNFFNKERIELFYADSSAYAFLAISEQETIYGHAIDSTKWNILQKDTETVIENQQLNLLIKEYAEKKIVYKFDCQKDFFIFDGKQTLDAIWIKKEGEISFLYYDFKCGYICLNSKDKQKISAVLDLMKIISAI